MSALSPPTTSIPVEYPEFGETASTMYLPASNIDVCCDNVVNDDLHSYTLPDSTGHPQSERLFSLVRREISYESFNNQMCIGFRKSIPGMWDGLWESVPSVTEKANWVPSFLLIGLPGARPAEEAFMRTFLHVRQTAEPIIRSRICYTVDEVTKIVLESKAAPSVLVFVGHGIDDGKYLTLRQKKDMGPCYFQTLFDNIVGMNRGSRFRLCIFLSCYLGRQGGLTERLAQVCPVTTISFCEAVWSNNMLPVKAAAHFAAVIVGLYGGWHSGNSDVHWLLAAERLRYPEQHAVNVHRLVFDLAKRMDSVGGHLQCQPVMRNDRGYHDSQWWPRETLDIFWQVHRQVAIRFIKRMDLHGAFHHPIFDGLPGRRMITPQEAYTQLPMYEESTETKVGDGDVVMGSEDEKEPMMLGSSAGGETRHQKQKQKKKQKEEAEEYELRQIAQQVDAVGRCV